MSTRFPSNRSQQGLASALLRTGATRKDLARLLRDIGREELSYKLPRGDDDETELRDGVRLLAQRGALSAQFFDSVQTEYPELAERLASLRVEMELAPPARTVVDRATLDGIKLEARQGGLHRGVGQSRLKLRLPHELRSAAATSLDEPDQLDAWIDAADRQRIEPGDDAWMLQFLESAVVEASEPGKSRLRDRLNDLRLRLPADLRRVHFTDEDRGSLQRMVQKYGIMLNTAEFLAAVSAGLARCCLVRIGGHDVGTAFLVGDDLVLTNAHVLFPHVDNMGPGQVEFCFDYRSEGEPGHVTRLKLAVPEAPGDRSWLVDTSPATAGEQQGRPEPIEAPTSPDCLDFALVRIAEPMGSGPAPGLDRRGWFDIAPGASQQALAPGTALMIFGHPINQESGAPVARPQVFSIAPDAVIGTNPNGTRVRYRTNTDVGSSGSPVLTAEGRVVALHHFGKDWEFNQGIPLAAIVARPKVAAALGAGP